MTVKYFPCISISPCAKIKYFPCVSKIFPVSQQNSLCFPCLEKVRTKFPVFPVSLCRGHPVRLNQRGLIIAPLLKKIELLGGSIFLEVLKWPWNCHALTFFKNDQNRSKDISLCPLCSNVTKNMADDKFPCTMV